jgi:hypothetical protein
MQDELAKHMTDYLGPLLTFLGIVLWIPVGIDTLCYLFCYREYDCKPVVSKEKKDNSRGFPGEKENKEPQISCCMACFGNPWQREVWHDFMMFVFTAVAAIFSRKFLSQIEDY